MSSADQTVDRLAIRLLGAARVGVLTTGVFRPFVSVGQQALGLFASPLRPTRSAP